MSLGKVRIKETGKIGHIIVITDGTALVEFGDTETYRRHFNLDQLEVLG